MGQGIADTKEWILVSPEFNGDAGASEVFEAYANDMRKYNNIGLDTERHNELEHERKKMMRRFRGSVDKQRLIAVLHIMIDLVKQGWQVQKKRGDIYLCRPNHVLKEEGSREVIRMQHYAERNEQLKKTSVQAFVRSMEAKRYWKEGFVSVYSLMRDGRELGEKLKAVRNAKDEAKQNEELAQVVQPYIQFVRGEERCKVTGLRLADIWRYFRHTWANPYNTVPGRNLMMIVRDAATPHHAVIGIASLSSATVANRKRDEYLGWTGGKVVERLKCEKSAKMARWLCQVVDKSIDEIYKNDLFDKVNGPLTKYVDIRNPTEEVVQRLIEKSEVDRRKHYRLVQEGDHKKVAKATVMSDEYWVQQAETNLFRAKREMELARLLQAKMVLDKYFGEKVNKKTLGQFVEDREFREVVTKVVRKAKADRVGIAMVDLSVCGAIPPYNEILGAKLVAMLATSPEVINEYRKRYGKQPSIIASSMAGKPVVRPAELVCINTTSLYGQRPNQYDRLSMPCDEIIEGCDGTIRYKYLGKTLGFGTYHLSEQTTKELATMVSQGKQGQRVNSIFGEGVSPRLRKLRDGLDALRLPTNDL